MLGSGIGISYGQLAGYGSLSLTETSPPQSFDEPFTPSEVASFLKLPERSPDDEDETALLIDLISAARTQAELMQGRDLVRKQWDLSFDYWLGYRMELRDPLISVDLVRYRDSGGAYAALGENVDYIVDNARCPGVIAPMYNKTWPVFTPWPSSALLIRFTSGYDSTSAFWSDA